MPEQEFTLFPWAPDELNDSESEAYAYQALRHDEPLHRILGHPDLVQDTPVKGEDVLLLQVDFYDSVAFPGGAGRLYYVISQEDLSRQNLEAARSQYDCD